MSHARSHDWIKSTLGHGETMCRNCSITNREAAVLGCLDVCDAAPVPSGQTVIEAASNNFGLTVADLDERREAIARHNQELALGFCKASFQKRFNLSDSRTEEYASCIVDLLTMATDFASGLVQDEAGIREKLFDRAIRALEELTAVVRGECPSLLNEDSGGDGELSVEIDEIIKEADAIRSARDGGEG